MRVPWGLAIELLESDYLAAVHKRSTGLTSGQVEREYEIIAFKTFEDAPSGGTFSERAHTRRESTG